MTDSQKMIVKIMKYSFIAGIISCIIGGVMYVLERSVIDALRPWDLEVVFFSISLILGFILFITFIAFLISLIVASSKEK